MAKFTPNTFTTLSNETSAVAKLNANLTAIQTAIENTLSRDGTSPNSMQADLDMNSNNILNLPYPASSTEPVRLGDLGTLVAAAVAAIATGPQGATGNPTGIQFDFTALTTDADNGPGKFWYNNSTISSVTVVYFDNLDYFTNNVTAWLDSFDDYNDNTARGYLYIQDVDTPACFASFKVTGSVVDGSGYRKVSVVHLSSNGTPSGRSAITFVPAGTAGSATGNVSATATFVADNRLVRTDGTVRNVQDSGITIDDSNNMTGVVNLGVTTIDLGNSDTTLSRTGAGAIAVEGVGVALNSISLPHTASQYEVGNASDTTITRAAAGKIAVEGAVAKLAGKETVFIPSAGMLPRTTNGPSVGVVEMTTNKNMFRTLDFDTTTQEFVQFFIRMPKSWDEGTITAAFTWSHASTTVNFGVVWALEAVAISDLDAGDVAFGTAQQIADTGGTTNTVYITSATPSITIAGSPQPEDWVMFQVKRVPADASDTMAIDARLHGVTLYFNTNDANDA